MPLYMDIHELPGVKHADVAHAHEADMKVQGAFGVQYLKYWCNESCGKVFCLVDAPSPEAAAAVHKQAHGLVAERIIEVTPEIAEGFLGGTAIEITGAAMINDQRDTGVRTILFTDIVGSTATTQNFGDDQAMTILRSHNAIVRSALTSFCGREIKHTGDGIMSAFWSAAAAVRCAAKIQRELELLKQRNDGLPFMVRIGASAGEPVEEHNDLYGVAVQLAARLCSHASPCQIVVSKVVVDLCAGKPLPFDSLGEVILRGFLQPVHAYAVAWDRMSDSA